ncbi:PREDICTED: putative nuclease HARBI1 [Diuraphis noxia]|uniref:putative nuclease HARBI1 n=1 Tax=Diuraphis noxia TaxID=143948 RepID=UPI0007638E44|nr:PREDICTED: putative nuclease HARBI1 [Diuraphis noxia]
MSSNNSIICASVQCVMSLRKVNIESDIILKKSSEVDELLILKCFSKFHKTRALSDYKERQKIKNYVATVYRQTPAEFKFHFRLLPSTFEFLLMLLPPVETVLGRTPISIDRRLLLTLWVLANEKETFRSVAERFGVSESSAHRIFTSTVNDIHNLRHEYIVWPRGAERVRNSLGFQNLRNIPFPGAFAAVDCTHIRISGNIKDNSYLNRNRYHSVNLQAVCDFDGLFIDAFVGFPGSCHDAFVFSNSPLYQALEDNPRLLLPNEHYILGDSAYPLKKYLMKPYRRSILMSPEQKFFNTVLSSSRTCIEQAFGSLKGRFRRLKGIESTDITFISKTTVACCILHNLCAKQGEDIEEYVEVEDGYDSNEQGAVDYNQIEEETCRDDICRILYNTI